MVTSTCRTPRLCLFDEGRGHRGEIETRFEDASPRRAERQSAENVGGPVNAEVDACRADRRCERARRTNDRSAMRTKAPTPRCEERKRQIEGRRRCRVSRGERSARYVLEVFQERWARAPEHSLEAEL